LLVGDSDPVFEFKFRSQSGKVGFGLPVDLVHCALDALATRAEAVMTKEFADVAMIAVLIGYHGIDVCCFLSGRRSPPFDRRIHGATTSMSQLELESAIRSDLGQGKEVQMEVAFVGVLDNRDETRSVLGQQPFQGAPHPQMVYVVVRYEPAHIGYR
jgi:hypothetical protein